MAPKIHIQPGIMEHVKAPFRAAVSPTARRTYLSTVLFIAASLVLLGVAAIAYPVFYYNYVPKKVVSIPVHLQYNAALNPYGVASISPNLMLEQAYDVSVELSLPRSPANLERGNFMVALYALRSTQPPPNPAMLALPTSAPTQQEEPAQNNPYAQLTPDRVVFASRRPVLIPYEDPLVSTTSRVMFLLYHALFAPAAAEMAALAVPMGELVLAEGRDGPPLATSGGPLSLLLDVQAGQTLQVYAVTVKLVARLSGVRWAMYNYRVLSFLVCTAVFWASEMLSMALAWLALGYFFAGRREQENKNQALARREGEGRDLGRARRRDFLDDDDDDGMAGEAENPMYEIKREDGDGDDDDDYLKEEEDVKIKKEESEEPESTLVGTPRQAAGPAADAVDEEEAKDDDTWKEIPGPATRTGFDDGRTGGDGGRGGLLLRKRSSHGAMS
ncbi:putative adipose-regulatory protein-domain-containing protein [Biscogniauxia mediterranea]|nr:putative adipose-regulatory protein-domain-containing protein [Biscogniauxia mediterranea]